MSTPDISADLARSAGWAGPRRSPEAVSVLVASRDPDVIAEAAPLVARQLYPGRIVRGVLHHEPHPDPDWIADLPRPTLDALAGQWSAVDVEIAQEMTP